MLLIQTARFIVQHAAFGLLMYGGRWGLRLGPALPCFACPYVTGCGGYCYLMAFQGYLGFGLSWSSLAGSWGLRALSWFMVFVLLVVFLGKTWCGWLCPFGLIQDWLSALRKRLGLWEAKLSVGFKARLAWLKYLLLVYLALIPVLITAGLAHPDFGLPFCNICPAKPLLPLLAGQGRYLALDFTNSVTLGFSLISLALAGSLLVGMFLKERLFCLVCPMLALIHILKLVTMPGLVKNPQVCQGCGTCRRVCPMDIQKVYEEKSSTDVQSDECLNCLKCVESCSVDGALGLKWGPLKLFSSSRSYVAGLKRSSS